MSKAITLLLALAGVLSSAHGQGTSPGSQKAAMCMGCHNIQGYQASFPEVYKVPRISGQSSAYIAAALNAYKKGERKHPSMRAIAASLTDKDIAELSAFYEQENSGSVKGVAMSGATAGTTAAPNAPANVGALLAKGACASCHGADYNKPIAPNYPKLAGQHGDYLYAALRAYGTENHALVGRANAIMAGQVKPFSRAELRAMADHLASLPGDLRTVPQPRFR